MLICDSVRLLFRCNGLFGLEIRGSLLFARFLVESDFAFCQWSYRVDVA